jgi:hypothetical protein
MDVAHDYQFDKSSEDYLGFLNVGQGLEYDLTWMEIVNPSNRDFVLHIMDQLNLTTENGLHLDLEETIFVKK